MNDVVHGVAIAGLLHDVGKFAERAEMELPVGYATGNENLYQPNNNGRPTHRHALYTAAFIDRFSDVLPLSVAGGDPRSGNSLINMAAMHHKPETPLQWVVTMADRLSSGLDRQIFEEDPAETHYRDFRRTRLLPVAEEMFAHEERTGSETLDGYRYRFPLAELTPETIFPGRREEVVPADNQRGAREYAALFSRFVAEQKKLAHREVPELWLNHFVSLWERFTCFIPAATVGKVIPDVSLYDHSRATAALATALYCYHEAEGTLTEQSVRDNNPEKFRLITGDFSGIQKFIFSEGGSTNRAAAKLLRGRSFAVSLLSELAGLTVCRELGLPSTSIILNAAGKFTMIAPNLSGVTERIDRIERELNGWLLDAWFGEVTISFSTISASPADFEQGKFPALWQKLARAAEQKKYRKIPLDRLGVQSGYLDSFDNRLQPALCPFCGRRPAHPSTKGDHYLGDNEASCLICRDHIHLGAHLIKGRTLAIIDADASFAGNRLKAPLMGRYQVSFDLDQQSVTSLVKQNALRSISVLGSAMRSNEGYGVRIINGYVPVYTDEDQRDERILQGRMSEEKKLELIDMIKEGGVKSFHHIAKTSRVPHRAKEGEYSGIEALGVLKADVDNLGSLFGCGLQPERLNLSRLATFSRQMNSFFSLYLPNLLATDPRFRNIYTVFAGGDDLFLIGPWNRIVDFADVLEEEFRRFACKNPRITISAGITVSKPGIAVPAFADRAEEALEESKHGGRNRVTLFGETVPWDLFRQLLQHRDRLERWQGNGIIGKAFLYQLNELVALARREKELVGPRKTIDFSDMSCLAWRSRLHYTIARNVGKGLEKDSRLNAVEEVVKTVPVWVNDHDTKLRIALWQVLYNQR